MIYYCNIILSMVIEKSKVLIQFVLIFRQSGDVLFFLYVPVGFADVLRQPSNGEKIGPNVETIKDEVESIR